jgi:stage IV sporulation protein FA
MHSRADEVRRRIAKRKKEREKIGNNQSSPRFWADDEERYGLDKMPVYEGGSNEGNHPLFKKEVFIFKVLASITLLLVVAIMFKNTSSVFDPARTFVKNSMDKDFQFAAVSDWYEEQFGKPLALLPFSDNETSNEDQFTNQYALPASRILEEFDTTGQRISIEIGKGAAVEAMNEGMVRFAGEKEGFGKTVILQHGDKSETWYGNLDSIDVNLYEYISKGTKVGAASTSADGTKGTFYFALKKGNDFIDPIQVIEFD